MSALQIIGGLIFFGADVVIVVLVRAYIKRRRARKRAEHLS